MSDLARLHQIQELDLQIEAQHRLLQEVEAALADTSAVEAARVRISQLQDVLHQRERQLRELEWTVEDLTRHLQADEKKLYSGTIHNPKELEGLRLELEQRQARRQTLEDQELQLMAEIEEAQSALAQARAQLAQVEATATERRRALTARQAELAGQLAAWQSERAQLAAAIPVATLHQYEQLRRDKRGRAVSRIERATCQGCRIALPMSVVQRVRAGRDLVQCPSCGRILYA